MSTIENNNALRSTKQRSAIRQAFAKTNRPLSPNEVLNIAAKEVPNLGIATVYRNINTMIQNGELQVRDLPGQPPRYCVPCDAKDKPSLFVCKKTNRVFHLDNEHVKFPMPSLPEEFKVDHYELIFYGDYKGKEHAEVKEHVKFAIAE